MAEEETMLLRLKVSNSEQEIQRLQVNISQVSRYYNVNTDVVRLKIQSTIDSIVYFDLMLISVKRNQPSIESKFPQI